MLDFAVEAGTVLRDARKKSQRRMRRAVWRFAPFAVCRMIFIL